MLVVGLTGGIAMGKSFIARILSAQHIPIFDADKVVAKLLQEDQKLIQNIEIEFSESMVEGLLVKKLLAEQVLYDKQKLQVLERIIHPPLIRKLNQFIKNHLYRRSKIIVLDIPLLFEIKLNKICSFVMMANAAKFLQKKRALARKNMSEPKLKTIISNQLANHKKILKADYILYTGKSKTDLGRQVRVIFKKEGSNA